jgi:hypothetical protein
MSTSLSNVVPGNPFEQVPGLTQLYRETFAAILACLEQGNGARAEQACTDMFARQADLVVRLLQNQSG